MKKMVFTESQIVKILCEARRTSVDDVALRHNITEATIYAWRSKFGRLDAEHIKRLRHLKTEHARRQRLVKNVPSDNSRIVLRRL
jgi:putative transposase